MQSIMPDTVPATAENDTAHDERESKVYDRDMLVMPQGSLLTLTTEGRAYVLDAALKAAERAHRHVVPGWVVGELDSEGGGDGPSHTLPGGKITVSIGWGPDTGINFSMDSTLADGCEFTPDSADDFARALTHMAALVRASQTVTR